MTEVCIVVSLWWAECIMAYLSKHHDAEALLVPSSLTASLPTSDRLMQLGMHIWWPADPVSCCCCWSVSLYCISITQRTILQELDRANQAKHTIYSHSSAQPWLSTQDPQNPRHDMYIKSHAAYAPGEQRHRDYDWTAAGINPQTHTFGEHLVTNRAVLTPSEAM